VTGGWAGIGLGDGLGAELTVTVEVWIGVTVTVVLPSELGELPSLDEWLVTAAVIVNEDTDDVEVPDGEQAERVTAPSRTRAPQPATVSLPRSAILPIAVPTFIEPPHAPFPPTPAAENRHRKETRGLPDRLPASAEGNRR